MFGGDAASAMNVSNEMAATSVLVVEDNPGDSRLVEVYLLEDPANSFKVAKSATLAGGLQILDSQHIDVVLLDLSLPDSFGLDTLARLRAAKPLVPVVVLTGNSDDVLALEALRQGAQDYLVKGRGDGDLVRRAARYAIERSRVDQALRDSEARFRAVFQNAGVGVVLADNLGNFVECNPAFCTMVAYSQDELRSLNLQDITHPDDKGEADRIRFEISNGTRDIFHFTKRYIAKDQRVVWVRLMVKAVHEDNSSDIRFIVAVVEDITERKRLEDHMRLAATVFESTGEALFVTDANQHIILVNPAFTEITGYQPADVVGKTPKVLSSGRHGQEFYEHMWLSVAETGRWQGEIWDRRSSGEMFASWVNISAVRDGNGMVSNYVAVFSDITSRKQIEERLSYQANHDPLTRLPNRTLFNERLSRALARAHRNQTMVALLFIDLDKFKHVNDTMGHLAGDQLLQIVAERLSNCIRQGDTVARLSGDEFTIVLEDIADPRDAALVAHKVLHLLSDAFELSGGEAHISASIGVALYPVDSGDSQGLIKLADAAMYNSKNSGRNGCQFHSESVNAEAFERLALENALREGIEREELMLVYQPVFDMKSGRVTDVEALLRWRHPDVGLVIPGQFLPMADETGLIVPIGRWVMKQACTDVAWLRQAVAPGLRLHINVSARQLRQLDLVESLASVLEECALPPSALVIEIPESGALDKGQDPVALFSQLNAMGIGLSIDEFGSGYSSFSFLRRLPVDELKIAQSFVRNSSASTDDAEIVSAVVAVARGLHRAVVAPGVETEEQLAFLSSFGCDRVQGFLLAKPMPVVELHDFLARGEIPAALAKRIN